MTASTTREIAALTVRTWLRYLVPLTLLSALTLALVAWIAAHAAIPTDAATARATIRLGWMLVAAAPLLQLLLVAAVAPAVRGLARDAPLSQWQALTAGARSLSRGLVPWMVAIAAILIGGLALVVPAFVLLVLLAMTGASDELGAQLPAPLVDSISAARSHLVQTAIVVTVVIALDVVLALAVQLLVSHTAKPGWVSAQTFVRAVALGLVAISPLAACALAATYRYARPSAASGTPRVGA